MTTYAHRATKPLLLALSAAAVATTLTAAATPVAAHAETAATTTTTTTTAAAVPALTWRDCAQPKGPAGQECAELPVPLDYRRPDGPQLTIAVSRLRSERLEARRGTLLVIAGGPGGSGVQRLTQKGEALLKEMAGAYDIVSFDPRGVGGSTTASCGLEEGDRHLVTLRSWPGPDGGIAENVARSRRTADACDRNGGAVLRSFTSANEVRDIDRFRRALGEKKLSAWGTSYGTYVGAVYAQKYPQHTDRWVLDSSGDPDPSRVAQGWMANSSPAVEESFPDFAAWSADPARAAEGLRLAERPEDVRPLFLALAAKLDPHAEAGALRGQLVEVRRELDEERQDRQGAEARAGQAHAEAEALRVELAESQRAAREGAATAQARGEEARAEVEALRGQFADAERAAQDESPAEEAQPASEFDSGTPTVKRTQPKRRPKRARKRASELAS